MDISLITSLYRADAHLPTYVGHVLDVAARLRAKAGLMLEIILVANDSTPAERELIARFANAAAVAGTPALEILHVERETLYASWNRGIRASSGLCLGFWNVDDLRTTEALIEGYRLIEQGCNLAYFPYTIVQPRRVLGLLSVNQRIRYPALAYDRELFRRSMRGASFFLFARELYQRVGPFDPNFRIAGDFEWCVRATDITDFCPGTQLAGTFALHGDNLSESGNPLLEVEQNIVHLRRGAWGYVTPAEPALMRASWMDWGGPEIELPESVAAMLRGPQAHRTWQRWQRSRRRARLRTQVSETLRAGPRFVINRTGLRPLFARLGIVKSASADR